MSIKYLLPVSTLLMDSNPFIQLHMNHCYLDNQTSLMSFHHFSPTPHNILLHLISQSMFLCRKQKSILANLSRKGTLFKTYLVAYRIELLWEDYRSRKQTGIKGNRRSCRYYPNSHCHWTHFLLQSPQAAASASAAEHQGHEHFLNCPILFVSFVPNLKSQGEASSQPHLNHMPLFCSLDRAGLLGIYSIGFPLNKRGLNNGQ